MKKKSKSNLKRDTNLDLVKKDVNNIISRVYKELKNENTNIIFKKLRGCHGEYDYLEDEIYIDLRKEILPTIVHELLHKWHPEKSEKWVIRQEKHIMQHITLAQSINIITFLLYKR